MLKSVSELKSPLQSQPKVRCGNVTVERTEVIRISLKSSMFAFFNFARLSFVRCITPEIGIDICDAFGKSIEIKGGFLSIMSRSNCIPTVIRLVGGPEY